MLIIPLNVIKKSNKTIFHAHKSDTNHGIQIHTRIVPTAQRFGGVFPLITPEVNRECYYFTQYCCAVNVSNKKIKKIMRHLDVGKNMWG